VRSGAAAGARLSRTLTGERDTAPGWRCLGGETAWSGSSRRGRGVAVGPLDRFAGHL